MWKNGMFAGGDIFTEAVKFLTTQVEIPKNW
jgi:hypothetical protein